jgi:hypothetical protein
MDPLSGLIDRLLASSTVTAIAGDHIYKGFAAQIGEVEYPCVIVERHSIGIQFEQAPVGDFDILISSRAADTDTAWRLHAAVLSAVSRATWTNGTMHCNAIATTRPFDLPIEEDGARIYPVGTVYRVRTFGD